MNEDTLRDMVEHMTEKVGLVHQLPYMMDGDLRFSRIVEKVSVMPSPSLNARPFVLLV